MSFYMTNQPKVRTVEGYLQRIEAAVERLEAQANRPCFLVRLFSWFRKAR